jgi:hypothetical protein
MRKSRQIVQCHVALRLSQNDMVMKVICRVRAGITMSASFIPQIEAKHSPAGYIESIDFSMATCISK